MATAETVAWVRPPEAIRGPARLHVQGALARLTAKRDISVLSKAVDEHHERDARQKTDYEAHAKTLTDPTTARSVKTTRRTKLNEGTEKRLHQLGEGDSLPKILTQWQESHKTPETEKLRAARASAVDLKKKLEGAKGAKTAARQQVSERERETSPHLYDRLLTLVDEVCREAPTLQLIITRTTPPPEALREPPTRILRPSRTRASGDELLLDRWVENLLAWAAPSSPDASEVEEL